MKALKSIVPYLVFLLIGLNIKHANAAAGIAVNPINAADKNPNLKKELRLAQLKLYTSLSVQEYEKLRGKKLNFFQKLSFKLSQRRMKNVLKAYSYGDGPSVFQKIGWLCKGILLGPLAVILAYAFLKDEERELIKWAWFGCIGFAAIVIILLAA